MNRFYLSLLLLFSVPLGAMENNVYSWSSVKGGASSLLTDYVVPGAQDVTTTLLAKANPIAAVAWSHKGKIALGGGATVCVVAGTLWAKGYYDTQINKLRNEMNVGFAGLGDQVSAVRKDVRVLSDNSEARFDKIDQNVAALAQDVRTVKHVQAKQTLLLGALTCGFRNIHMTTNTIANVQGEQSTQLSRIESAVDNGFRGVNQRLDGLASQGTLAPLVGVSRSTFPSQCIQLNGSSQSPAAGSQSADVD